MQILNYPETEVWLTQDKLTKNNKGDHDFNLVYIKDDYELDLTSSDKLGLFIQNKFVKFTGVIITLTQRVSFKDGFLHSFDGNHALSDNNASIWMSHGLPHRIGGPYITYATYVIYNQCA